MKRILFALIFILPAAAGLLETGCKKQLGDLSSYHPGNDSKLDSIRVYNLLPDSSGNGKNTGYLLYLNDSLILFKGMPAAWYQPTFGVQPYLTIPNTGGSFDIKLTSYSYSNDTPAVRNPPVSHIVLQTKIDLPAHSGYSDLFFYDDNGKPAVKFIPISSADPGAPAPGKFKIRVINFGYAMSPNAPSYPKNSSNGKYAVSLQYADSTALPNATRIPFGGVSNYEEIDYGTHQFLVYDVTDRVYLTNSGPLDDATKTFNIYPVSSDPNGNYNNLFPSVLIGNYYNQGSSLQVGNIGSYPFAAGSCYTVLVIGNIYAVLTDRRYGEGVLDNFGKVQFVHTNPNQQKVDVNIAWDGGQTTFAGLSFGQYTTPVTVPAGNVTLTVNTTGKPPFVYYGQVSRLANLSWYYSSDLNNIPFVLPFSNVISSYDYNPSGPNYSPVAELSKISVINLSPDAGGIFFTQYTWLTPTVESNLVSEVVYKAKVGVPSPYDGKQPPAKILARLSSKRKDTLAVKVVATLQHVFPTYPAPGTYTLAAAGLLNTTDTAKGIHLFMIKHTNFIPKTK